MTMPNRPPKDDLVRATFPAVELRAEGDGMPTMVGHFSRFGEWARIESTFEGTFMERVAPGAFRKTLAENRDNIRVLFQHGRDPQVGDKPLGPITQLREDADGAYYEVPLLDTSYNRDLLPGLQAGLYGASFRFSVVKEDFVPKPTRSTTNPKGIPERTIREARVMEFGPVTFPAYAGATASVRSLTDAYILERFTADPARLVRSLDDLAASLLADPVALATAVDKLGNGEPLAENEADLLEAAIDALEPQDCCTCCGPGCPCCAAGCDAGACCALQNSPMPDAMPATPMSMNALPKTGAERAHSGGGSRIPTPKPPERKRTVSEYVTRDDKAARVTELKEVISTRAVEYPGVFPADVQATDDADNAELDSLVRDIAAWDGRQARLATFAPGNGVPGWSPAPVNVIRDRTPEDIYDLRAVEKLEPEKRVQATRDNAMRSIESSIKSAPRNADLDSLAAFVDHRDSPDQETARRILLTGSPAYKRAFAKYLVNGNERGFTTEESRAAALAVTGTTTTGGYAVPYIFDPTFIAIGAHTSINPYRAACRVETISGGNNWRAVTATAITAKWDAEAAASVEGGPTIGQPTFTVQRADAFATVSIETLQDRPDVTGELSALFGEAKDTLEENSFTLGTGATVYPFGMFRTAAFTAFATATNDVTAIADIRAIEADLPLRHRANAAFFMSRSTQRQLEALDTTGYYFKRPGQFFIAGSTIPATNATGNTGSQLLGYPIWEVPSAVSTLTTDAAQIAVFGDPKNYVIVDRIGMNVEVVPTMLNGATPSFPTGQRGIYCYWRGTARPLNVDGMRQLVVQ